MPRPAIRVFRQCGRAPARLAVSAALLILHASPFCLGDMRPTAVILCEGVHADALRDPELSALRELAHQGSAGLMTMPPALARSPHSAMLSIAIGAPASGVSTDADAYQPTETVEGDTALQVLNRRMGTVQLPQAHGRFFVHIGIGSLIRRGFAERLPGAGAGPDAPLSVDTSFWKSGGPKDLRLGSLMAVGPSGVGRVSDGSRPGIIFIQVGRNRRRLDGQIRRWKPLAGRLWVISYLPAPREVHPYLSRPTLTVLWERPSSDERHVDGDKGKGAGLTSATTRTPGLISFTDVAPTMREWTGLAAHTDLSGHTVNACAHPNPLGLVAASDRVAATNARAMVTVLMLYGILAGLAIAAGLTALRMRPQSSHLAAVLNRACMPLPIAFLLSGPAARFAPDAVPPGILTAEIGIGCLLIWAMAELIARVRFGARPLPRMAVIMALTVVVIGADGMTGQRLMKDSVLAAAGRAGARYYGIGNEYMGFLVAASLGLACLLEAGTTATAALGLVIVCTLGLGSVGANAGGVVTAATGFLACITHQAAGRLSLRNGMLCFAAGIGLALAFAALDRAIAGAGASHLGATVGRAADGDAAAILTIASRKADLAISSILSPHGLFSLIGFAAICVAAAAGFRRDLERVGVAYPGWVRWHSVSVLTALAAFVANDTGLVPMLIIYGSCLMVGLTLRFDMAGAAEDLRGSMRGHGAPSTGSPSDIAGAA